MSNRNNNNNKNKNKNINTILNNNNGHSNRYFSSNYAVFSSKSQLFSSISINNDDSIDMNKNGIISVR